MMEIEFFFDYLKSKLKGEEVKVEIKLEAGGKRR